VVEITYGRRKIIYFFFATPDRCADISLWTIPRIREWQGFNQHRTISPPPVPIPLHHETDYPRVGVARSRMKPSNFFVARRCVSPLPGEVWNSARACSRENSNGRYRHVNNSMATVSVQKTVAAPVPQADQRTRLPTADDERRSPRKIIHENDPEAASAWVRGQPPAVSVSTSPST